MNTTPNTFDKIQVTSAVLALMWYPVVFAGFFLSFYLNNATYMIVAVVPEVILLMIAFYCSFFVSVVD